MKFTKPIAIMFVAASLLTGCGDSQNSNKNDNDNFIVKQSVKKHEAVELPTEIYVDSDYNKLYGLESTFKRVITAVEVSDFDEQSAVEFLNRYDSAVERQNFNLVKDFKLLKISLSHVLEGDTKFVPSEAFMLNEGSGLVLGERNISNEDEFLGHQLSYISTDYRVGKTSDETGDILLAVPKEFVDAHLQLKIRKKHNKEVNDIYIDLVD